MKLMEPGEVRFTAQNQELKKSVLSCLGEGVGIQAPSDEVVNAWTVVFERYFDTHNIKDAKKQEQYISNLTFVSRTLRENQFFEKMRAEGRLVYQFEVKRVSGLF